jgi:hypothetical protein
MEWLLLIGFFVMFALLGKSEPSYDHKGVEKVMNDFCDKHGLPRQTEEERKLQNQREWDAREAREAAEKARRYAEIEAVREKQRYAFTHGAMGEPIERTELEIASHLWKLSMQNLGRNIPN